MVGLMLRRVVLLNCRENVSLSTAENTSFVNQCTIRAPRGLACSDVACAPASWLPESSPTRPVVCRSVLLDESCLIVPEPDGVSTAMRALASGIDSGCSGPTGAIVLNGCVSLTVSAVAALKFRWGWVVASVVCRAVLLSKPASRTGF